MDPKFIQGQCNYAVLLTRMGKTEQAEKYYQKIISDDPKFMNAYINYCDILEKKGKVNEAKKIF